MNSKKCLKIFEVLKKNNPHPRTELLYQSDFELLVSVMLSARATDKSVNQATPALFAKANTPHAILALGEENLKTFIKKIGLYQTKAKNILKTAKIIEEEFKGQVPATLEALESLPGVGRKTAHVVLNTLFAQAVIAVDTHVFRVARRIGLSQGTTLQRVEKDLMQIIPEPFLKNAHHWLVLHGRYTCKALKPACKICPIQTWCEYPHKLLL